MYAIYDDIYHEYTPNVSIYTIHGSYGYGIWYGRLTLLSDLIWSPLFRKHAQSRANPTNPTPCGLDIDAPFWRLFFGCHFQETHRSYSGWWFQLQHIPNKRKPIYFYHFLSIDLLGMETIWNYGKCVKPINCLISKLGMSSGSQRCPLLTIRQEHIW